MEQFYNETLNRIKTVALEFEIKADYSLHELEAILNEIVKELTKVKKYILKNGFAGTDEEILFFKVHKPNIVSNLIYYNAIYKIEAKKPYGGQQVLEDYLVKELSELKRFYDRNIEFCKYYRTNSTYLDHKYFVREQHDIKLSLDTFSFEADSRFSTSHDFKVAKIIANDRLEIYLENQLNNTNQKSSFENCSLKWTASKAAATELIYGLYLSGVFNNGQADIVVIVRHFEHLFGIDLGDFYHTFTELKSRKINRTKFSDEMREALIKRMDEQDEK
ncbi:tetracycline regulation of excision, RteC [Chryseobacterium sp. POL2]|uniref:RteC domain-containing protein n=1 Tax=Chryseobacterium TaxID=59732 RepID=UPI0013E17992|nr:MULTISPECIES: RteC domain-containing protein [Chryseobacterium]MDM1554214.1 RteC domain-containing protein [Chryseobacterium indologenes]QIG89704.1 tetracycline regulation of excision, RteC [Chryseobacterium sp. POL2]